MHTVLSYFAFYAYNFHTLNDGIDLPVTETVGNVNMPKSMGKSKMHLT